MDQFYKIAYEYYFQFYSYSKYYQKLKYEFWGTLIFGVAFIFGIFVFIAETVYMKPEYFFKSYSIWAVFALEGLFLYLWAKLQRKRTNLVLDNKKYTSAVLALVNKKKKWLKDEVGISDKDYFRYAKEFESMRDMCLRNKNTLEFDPKDLWQRIYDSNSKARILSLVVFLFSIMALVSIKSIPGPEVIFEAFSGLNWYQLLSLVFIYALMLFIVMYGSIYMIRFSSNVLNLITLAIDGDKTRSERIAGFLIRDLVRLNSFSKYTNK